VKQLEATMTVTSAKVVYVVSAAKERQSSSRATNTAHALTDAKTFCFAAQVVQNNLNPVW
jgi:hypothetical protein